MKIAIIGYPYSGQVELAQYLEKKFFCPTLYLDHIFPKSEASDEIKKQMLENYLKENISWVIEGSYDNILFEKRMEEADKIVIMRFNRFACLFKYLRAHRKANQEINEEEIKELFINSRKKEHRKLYNKVMRQYSEKVVLMNRRTHVLLFRDII